MKIGVRNRHAEIETIMKLVRAAVVGAPLLLGAIPTLAQSDSSPSGTSSSAIAPDLD
jgi:hypothetical protein